MPRCNILEKAMGIHTYWAYLSSQMYRGAMDSVQQFLFSESVGNGFKYTSEMHPEQTEDGQMFVCHSLLIYLPYSNDD